MKNYVKPTIEYVELRPEERLAASTCHQKNFNDGNDVPNGNCLYPHKTN